MHVTIPLLYIDDGAGLSFTILVFTAASCSVYTYLVLLSSTLKISLNARSLAQRPTLVLHKAVTPTTRQLSWSPKLHPVPLITVRSIRFRSFRSYSAYSGSTHSGPVPLIPIPLIPVRSFRFGPSRSCSAQSGPLYHPPDPAEDGVPGRQRAHSRGGLLRAEGPVGRSVVRAAGHPGSEPGGRAGHPPPERLRGHHFV